MKYLLLWLEGPLQAWGADSRFDYRRTNGFPTISGLFGMLLASSGDSGSQEELLKRLADAPVYVVCFQKNGNSCKPVLKDFQMVGNGYDAKDLWETLNIPKKSDGGRAVGGGAKLTYREYLADSCFAAVCGLPDDLAEKFSKSLQHPVFDLYLGRKCCVPSTFIYQGLFESLDNAADTLREKCREKGFSEAVRVVCSIEDSSNQGTFLMNDIPIRFGKNRLYRDRWVVCLNVELKDFSMQWLQNALS